MRPRAFCEFPAGLAAVSLRLHGGKHCRPPISRMGNKQGYAEVILDALGLRSGQGADAYLWAEADPDVRAMLRAYPDAAMLTRIAEIIRGWADEEPRALWERLRAERKARGPMVEHAEAARWVTLQCGQYGAYPVTLGPDGATAAGSASRVVCDPNRDPTKQHGGQWPLTAAAAACKNLAMYATIAASNRLINVAGPDLMNTGAGGTTFGGADFATPAGDVAVAFERVAGWMYVNANSWKGEGDHWKDPSDDVIAAGITVCRSSEGIATDLERHPSRWPPVVVLPTIPSAADVAAWLGAPGDLEGCILYADPPYSGTTGYGSNLTRDEVIAYALDFDRLGAVVCISEAEPVIEGWHATEITGGRKGQKRTFSKQQREWLTMNRPPAATVATQTRMFA